MKYFSKAFVILASLACLSCAAGPAVTISEICVIGNEICSVEQALCGLSPKLAQAKTSQDSLAIVAKQDSLKLVLNGLAIQLQKDTK
jgi:hypothetical protein